jgi:hypothetical protein
MIKSDEVKRNNRKKCVSIMLGNIDTKISWKLTEQNKINLLKSFRKSKNNYFKGVYKIPQFGYQGCKLNLSPQNIYVFRNIIISKYKGILEVFMDNKRKFEKEILSTAPKDTIPDIIYELEF